MNDGTLGIIETLNKNKKAKFGTIFLILALAMGFTAIYMETKSHSEKGFLDSEKTVRMDKPRLNAYGKLYIHYTESGQNNTQVEISILDQKREVIESTMLKLGENKALNLSSDALFFKKESDTGRISYTYNLYYSHQPYRLLSIPALFLTIFGIILVYKGFDEYMNTVARERQRSKSREEENQQDIKFMGIDKEEDEG